MLSKPYHLTRTRKLSCQKGMYGLKVWYLKLILLTRGLPNPRMMQVMNLSSAMTVIVLDQYFVNIFSYWLFCLHCFLFFYKIPRALLESKLILIIWPPNRFGSINRPEFPPNNYGDANRLAMTQLEREKARRSRVTIKSWQTRQTNFITFNLKFVELRHIHLIPIYLSLCYRFWVHLTQEFYLLQQNLLEVYPFEEKLQPEKRLHYMQARIWHPCLINMNNKLDIFEICLHTF